MGIFSDIKGSIEAAQAISADDTVLSPTQRLDSLVIDPASGEQRHRSDYAGTIWFGGRPQIVNVRALPGATQEIDTILVLPDSHTYDATASAQIQATGALISARATSAGGDAQIMDLGARLGAEATAAGGRRVEVSVDAVALLPVGISYRVTVICAPEAVTPSAA